MDKLSAHYTIPYNHHCCHTHIQYCYCLNSWLFANTSCPQHHQRHYWFHILWKTLHLPWVSEMLYVTTHFLASEIIIFVVTEIHSSCNLLGQTILQHSNEKGIYPSATSVALPFASSMYHFLCLWCIKMPFGYPLTTWFHIPYHI